ncbi:hypothetical protein ACSLBF_08110 [Pseudoalteromonas sp. T1lg65]|uniref:hypothetical protein n=1 Tax=Pseudoalteromonas sp. T1lg65 TaxID=2077101 RepID=UPI003F79B65B
MNSKTLDKSQLKKVHGGGTGSGDGIEPPSMQEQGGASIVYAESSYKKENEILK